MRWRTPFGAPRLSFDSILQTTVLDVGGGVSPNKVARTIVIGDVHGCLDELQDLLRRCSIDPAADRVILVGDLVAKGPDSQGVVQLARERGFESVLGNHDAKVLSLEREAASRGTEGLATGTGGMGKNHVLVARSLGIADWRYLEALPLYKALPEIDTVVVHGGLVVGVPLAEQAKSLVINMRSITPTGEPSKRVDAGVPWASLWPGPAHVVFGHDAIRGLQRHPFATGLDTGCVYGRSLTALVLPEKKLVSVPARRAYVDI